MYDARKARLKELMEGLLADYPNVSTIELAVFWLATRRSIESCLRCCLKSGSTANASYSRATIETLDDRLACIAIERRVPPSWHATCVRVAALASTIRGQSR